MKVIQETVDSENYLEILLTQQEVKKINRNEIVSRKVELEEEVTNVGVRLIQPGE
jgi:hypothetical protein